jgi:hypothetical protein
MSTADQKLAAEIHGTALLLAQDERLQPLLDELLHAAAGRDDLRTQEAGVIAGSWFAGPGRHVGHELIAAGLLIVAGITDRDQLEEAVRIGFERGRGSLQTPVGQLVPGAAGARVLHRDRPLPGDDDDAVRVGAHSPGGREPAAQHLTESGVAPRVAVAEVGRCVGDAVADVFVEQADRDVLQEVTSGDQNKARDMVTEATQDIARIIKT